MSKDKQNNECVCGDFSPSAQNAKLALLAVDFFRGNISEKDRVEVGFGLMRAISNLLDRPDAVSYNGTGPWETVAKVRDILKEKGWKYEGKTEIEGNVKHKADGMMLNVWGQPQVTPASVACAAGIAIYYYLNPPSPSNCVPNALDKWQHCYVGCKIGFWCPGGEIMAAVVAALKEVADYFGLGEPDVEDIAATIAGAVSCGFFESCEDCCCRLGY